jgi:hypothetical protein
MFKFRYTTIVTDILNRRGCIYRISKQTFDFRLAIIANNFLPHPYLTQTIGILELVDAILTIIISSYDIIQGKGDLFDAIIELISSAAEFLPFTGFEDAEKVKRVVCTIFTCFYINFSTQE